VSSAGSRDWFPVDRGSSDALREVMVLEARIEFGEEVVDCDDGSSGSSGKSNGSLGSNMIESLVSFESHRGGSSTYLVVQRPASKAFIASCDLALDGTHERLAGHGHEDAVVAGGVIDEGVA